MMVEQAGDCIGFLGFLLYVGLCLLGKKYVYLKKNVHCNQPFLSGKLLKRGANSVASDHEAAYNHLSGLPLIAFTNLHHHHHQCENAQISCTITTMTAFTTQISCESRKGRTALTCPRFSRDEGDRGSVPPWHGS